MTGDIDFEEEEPLARFSSARLPDWTWEVYRVEDRDIEVAIDEEESAVTDVYFGRVKSPHTYDEWEYGSFSAYELKQAMAFRTDEDTGEWP